MKKMFVAAALGLLAVAGVAFAQTITAPQVTTITPASDLVQIIPRGQPAAQSVYAQAAALATQEVYAKVALTTSSNNYTSPSYSNTFSNYQADILITAPTTVPYTYFTFAPNPSDGARECIYSNQTVTAAYPTANTGQTVNSSNTITSMTANARYCFLYSASNLQWDRDGQ